MEQPAAVSLDHVGTSARAAPGQSHALARSAMFDCAMSRQAEGGRQVRQAGVAGGSLNPTSADEMYQAQRRRLTWHSRQYLR